MTTRPKSAIGYLRVSTTAQADEGISLEAQRDRIAEFCASRKFELVEVIEDAGISGKNIKDRPGLQAALARLKRGQVLVTYSWSRLARSTLDLLHIEAELKRRGVELASVTEHHVDTTMASGVLHFQMLATFGEFERRTIAERTRAAMQHLKRQGRFTGGEPPFGWRVEGGVLVPVCEEQVVVHLAHRLRHRQGLTLRQIVKELHFRGFKGRSGAPLILPQVQRMLNRAPANPAEWDSAGITAEWSEPLEILRGAYFAILPAGFGWQPIFLDLRTGDLRRIAGDPADPQWTPSPSLSQEAFRFLSVPSMPRGQFKHLITALGNRDGLGRSKCTQEQRAARRSLNDLDELIEAPSLTNAKVLQLERAVKAAMDERLGDYLTHQGVSFRWIG